LTALARPAGLVTLALLSLAADAVAAQTPTGGAPGAPAHEAPAVDLEAEEPPPSTWDRRQKDEEPPHSEERGLLNQLGRTLLALLIVVALIYGAGKFAMARLGNARFAGRGGDAMRVVERLQLDPKHALFLIELKDRPTLLVSSGETGVALLKELPAAPPSARPFNQVLAQAGERDGSAPSASEESP